ncbi:MAG: TetR/AcrR family transcriptional regulator [Pseudolabrys sp.]|nr:TetR/AcrR family transcriptional regulator [Pseudolabrys sp.]MDP2296755.1 TetR/AcrR family transcriptional regulator [Pseudolabrys sp.]
METDDAGRLRPRERIIKTARELFRRHGMRGIGVDAIAEQAGTNKMTLYRHFGSKDDLIVACLRDVAAENDQIWIDLETAYPGDPLAQLHAWLRVGAECAVGDSRGCDMANAAVELAEADHPARHVIEEFKTAHRNRLAKLCRDAGIVKADLLADSLWLLLEGARVSGQSVGATGPGAHLISIGEAMIAAFARRTPPERKAPKRAAVSA